MISSRGPCGPPYFVKEGPTWQIQLDPTSHVRAYLTPLSLHPIPDEQRSLHTGGGPPRSRIPRASGSGSLSSRQDPPGGGSTSRISWRSVWQRPITCRQQRVVVTTRQKLAGHGGSLPVAPPPKKQPARHSHASSSPTPSLPPSAVRRGSAHSVPRDCVTKSTSSTTTTARENAFTRARTHSQYTNHLRSTNPAVGPGPRSSQAEV